MKNILAVLALIALVTPVEARKTPFLVQGLVCMNPESLKTVFEEGPKGTSLPAAMALVNVGGKVLCVHHTVLHPLV